jgi:hypothetical protein
VKAISTADGSDQWEVILDLGGTSGTDYGYEVRADHADNAVYVAGYGRVQSSPYTSYGIAKKLDSTNDGTELWSTQVTTTKSNFCYAMDMDSDNIYLGGQVLRTDVNFWDMIITSIDKTTGDINWTEEYDGSLNYDDKVYGIAVDEDSQALYVVGTTDESNYSSSLRSSDMWVLKLKTLDGTIYDSSWDGGLVLTGPADLSEGANGVAVGPDLFYVAGYIETDGSQDLNWWVMSLDK